MRSSSLSKKHFSDILGQLYKDIIDIMIDLELLHSLFLVIPHSTVYISVRHFLLSNYCFF